MSGVLAWGLRASFLDYFLAVPDASMRLQGVAFDEVHRRLVFPLERVCRSKHELVAQAGGQALLTAHEGEMHLDLLRPAVLLTATEGLLTCDDSGGHRLTVARLLDATTDLDLVVGLAWRFEDVALSVEGTGLFGAQYAPWTRMAPVEVSLDEEPLRPRHGP
ncbi:MULTISPECIES: HtaA domain-containing protein [unclassified Modestobacter]